MIPSIHMIFALILMITLVGQIWSAKEIKRSATKIDPSHTAQFKKNTSAALDVVFEIASVFNKAEKHKLIRMLEESEEKFTNVNDSSTSSNQLMKTPVLLDSTRNTTKATKLDESKNLTKAHADRLSSVLQNAHFINNALSKLIQKGGSANARDLTATPFANQTRDTHSITQSQASNITRDVSTTKNTTEKSNGEIDRMDVVIANARELSNQLGELLVKDYAETNTTNRTSTNTRTVANVSNISRSVTNSSLHHQDRLSIALRNAHKLNSALGVLIRDADQDSRATRSDIRGAEQGQDRARTADDFLTSLLEFISKP